MTLRYGLILAAIATAASGQNALVTPRYEPITSEQRLAWFANTSFGPGSLLTGVVTAGLDTLQNTPEEYGTHWSGFGKRYGIRITNSVMSSGMEAGIGSLWGEDPRYFRVPERPFKSRIGNVVRSTFIAHDRNGKERPAYARFIAVPTAAFVSNGWRPDSEDDPADALNRIATSLANRMLGNAFTEFWPDARRRMFHHGSGSSDELLNKP